MLGKALGLFPFLPRETGMQKKAKEFRNPALPVSLTAHVLRLEMSTFQKTYPDREKTVKIRK